MMMISAVDTPATYPAEPVGKREHLATVKVAPAAGLGASLPKAARPLHDLVQGEDDVEQ
jgi:hypothetical protein